MPRSTPARYKQKAGRARWQVGGTASRDIMRHRAAGQESGAAGRHSGVAGDAVVQPEDVAERRKASGVAGTCSSTAEDVAVRRMPRGMLSGLGETLRNVMGWRWKFQQPGDAVRRQVEDGIMVGGGAGDRSGGGRHIGRRKTYQKAEDASEGRRRVGSRSRVRDGKVWHKGVPLTPLKYSLGNQFVYQRYGRISCF